MFGPVPQGDFLRTLGIDARAARLRQNVSADQAKEIDAALRRLTGTHGMGELVQGTGARTPDAGCVLPGFETEPCNCGAVMEPISHALLDDPDGRIRHGFFGRAGGVSEGLYNSLNCGYGSGDDPKAVRENRARATELPAGSHPTTLCTAYQVHSAEALVGDRTLGAGGSAARRCDGDGDARPGASAILTADCVPVLMADREAGVIGAAHAGWRGALNGILEAAVEAMLGLGARAGEIRAVIGPAIGATSYEVGPEFPVPFLARRPKDEDLFVPAKRGGHFLFDLTGYVARRLSGSRPRGSCSDRWRHLRRGRPLLQLPPERPPG